MRKEKEHNQKTPGFFMVFVIDTSAITDPRLKEALNATNTEEVVRKLSSIIADLRINLGALFYTTPSIVNEMKRFLLSNNVSQEAFNELIAWLIIKSPDKFAIRIPAAVMGEYVESIRKRTFKGLRVAEDTVKKAATQKTENTQELIAQLIHDLREKYREALRKGIVDSPEDFDAVILAYELKAVLVTNDEGMKKMAQSLGIITIDPLYFIDSLNRMRMAIRNG